MNVSQCTLPERDGRYELDAEATRDPGAYPVSTRVQTRWTFRTARTSGNGGERLPLTVVRFPPELSLSSTAKAGERFKVPFGLEGAATVHTVRKLSFEVSYDDGRSWAPAEAVGGKRLRLDHPARPGTVSLRARLTERDGSTPVRTIDRAHLTEQALRRCPGPECRGYATRPGDHARTHARTRRRRAESYSVPTETPLPWMGTGAGPKDLGTSRGGDATGLCQEGMFHFWVPRPLQS